MAEPRSRADLARRLLARVDLLEAALGDASLAAELLLLKRDLARGHEMLARRPSENDFRSVVTLVEAALACLSREEYTPAVLEALRLAFSAGTREGRFTFADYDAIRRGLAEAGIRTTPRAAEEE
jgi:hypothetical protein